MLVIPLYSWGFVDILPSLSWHTAVMVATALPDLDRLDIEALRALVV